MFIMTVSMFNFWQFSCAVGCSAAINSTAVFQLRLVFCRILNSCKLRRIHEFYLNSKCSSWLIPCLIFGNLLVLQGYELQSTWRQSSDWDWFFVGSWKSVSYGEFENFIKTQNSIMTDSMFLCFGYFLVLQGSRLQSTYRQSSDGV